MAHGSSTVDWDLVALIFMISLLVGLYTWKKFGGEAQRKYAFGTFLSLSIAFSIVMNTGNRPGGIYLVA
jgi:4-amino-4-deoxy-L-arabinose transferase-like glycosyltransferase